MKFVLSLLLFILPNVGFAHPIEQEKRTIQVTGNAEIRVVPDETIIAMSVQARNKNLLLGQKQVDDSVSAVLALLRKRGIKPEHVQTDYIAVTPVFISCDNSRRATEICDPTKTDYYDLKKGMVLRLKDLALFEAVVSDALQNGVTNIDNIQFMTTELRKYRDKARDMAVKAAKEKAEAVAGSLGQKVGKPISISLHNNGYYGSSSRAYNSMSQNVIGNLGGGEATTSNAEPSISLGQIKIDAEVSVTFELE